MLAPLPHALCSSANLSYSKMYDDVRRGRVLVADIPNQGLAPALTPRCGRSQRARRMDGREVERCEP